jgi:hypothetical protein
MTRFYREYRLVVGPPGTTRGVEIVPPMRITFEIEKNTDEEPNVHKIRIWNLAPETTQAIIKPDNIAVLYAGYRFEDGPILMASGNVLDGWVYQDGPDVITQLELRDGYVNVRDTVVSLGYSEGVQASRVIRDLAAQMGLSLLMGKDEPDRTWQNGFSFYGAAHRALHKVTAGTGLEWSIQNGQLQVIARRGVTPRSAFVIAPDSGLLYYPERTREGAREKAKVKDQKTGDNRNITSAKQQRDGWRVTSYLLPSLNPGDLVKLESKSVTGWFRIDKLTHQGDYGGPGDWQTELNLVERDAAPKAKNAKGVTTA